MIQPELAQSIVRAAVMHQENSRLTPYIEVQGIHVATADETHAAIPLEQYQNIVGEL